MLKSHASFLFLLVSCGVWSGCKSNPVLVPQNLASQNLMPKNWTVSKGLTSKNLIAVPIAPQVSANGRLVVSGIQLRDRIPVIDAEGRNDYFDKLVGNEARFWSAATLTPLPPLPLSATPGDLALSPDGSMLAISGPDAGFGVVGLPSQTLLWHQGNAASTNVKPEPGFSVVLASHGLSKPAFSPDSRTLAAWETFIDSDKGTTQITGHVFDARTGASKASWQGEPGSQLNDRALHFSPDGYFLASTELQPQVYLGHVPNARPEIRRVSNGKLLRILPFNGARIAAFGANNRLLLLINSHQYGTDVLEVDAITGKRLWSYTGTVKDSDGALSTIDSAFYSMDTKQIALCFRASKSVVILDSRHGKQLHRLQISAAPGAPYTSDGAFAFSSDGRSLLVMNQGNVSRKLIK